jgi:aspartyl-tRNA(Asn)/glutamyl-tRNA(Gln) amidotransferase subunit B
LFSPGSTTSQRNSNVGLFDLALPGTLPQLNRAAVGQAVRAAMALSCQINSTSHFDRKHYHYLDLPLGFQITQQDRPLGHSGTLSFRCVDENSFAASHTVAVERLQVEQDSAKSIHDANEKYSLIDFSRAGSALIEVVFAPTLRTPKQAASVLATVQQLLRHIDVSSGNLEDGSMRCDVNVSVAQYSQPLDGDSGDSMSVPELLLQGERVEVKNLSSLQRVEAAAAHEIERHISVLQEGGIDAIRRETRGFDVATGATYSLRTKEEAMDYRFFPCPDLPPLIILPEELDEYRRNLPELPDETVSRIREEYKLNDYQISVLFSLHVLKRFESIMVLFELQKREGVANSVFNWLTTDLAGVAAFNHLSIEDFPISDCQIFDIVCSIEEGKLTSQHVKKILISLSEDKQLRGKSVAELVSLLGLIKISDENLVRNMCTTVIEDPKNAKQLHKYRSGKLGMFNFFFGEVMKICNGQADHLVVRSVLESLLTPYDDHAAAVKT